MSQITSSAMTEPTAMTTPSRIKRRSFFGKTLTGIAGGAVFGNIFGVLFGAKRASSQPAPRVRVAPHPDSVPRTGKGVK